MSGRQRFHLKKIAVTGGIGSGKSTLVLELSRLGYPVFDADVLVAQVVDEHDVRQRIVELLGDEAYAADDAGKMIYQKSWVRDRVFSDAVARSGLEGIIHPAITRRFEEICSKLNSLVSGLWVFYEAALIFESGREREFDAVVSVVASEEIRRQRLLKSRKLSDATVSAIFSAQVTDQIRRSKSHFVVDNSDDFGALTQQAIELVQQLRNFFHPQPH